MKIVKILQALSAALLLALFACPGFADASLNNQSVGECLKNPDKCKDAGNHPKIEQEASNEPFSAGIMDFFKMIIALIFVISLLYFLLKFINKKSQSFQQNRIIQNLGGTALGGSRSVQIVKVGSHLFILGVGEDVQLLKEITDEQERESLLRQYNEQLEKSLQPSGFYSKIAGTFRESFPSMKKEEKSRQTFQTFFKSEMDQVLKRRNRGLTRLTEEESKRNE